MAHRQILTESQQEELLSADQLSEEEFNLYYSFSSEDIAIILNHRGESNKLGFAIQLCLARYPGCTLNNWHSQSQKLIDYVAFQLKISPVHFQNYGNRDNTRRDHLNEICQIYNFRKFDMVTNNMLEVSLYEKALENDDDMYLIQSALFLLSEKRILLPAILTIENCVNTARNQSETTLITLLTTKLHLTQKKKIDELLTSHLESKQTKLSWLKEISGKANPDAALEICKRIEMINFIDLDNIDISSIHPNRFAQMARVAENYDSYDFQRFNEDKKYALLVAFLIRYSQALVDQLIEILDRIMTTIKRKGINDSKEQQRKTGKAAKEILSHFSSVVGALKNAKENNSDPYIEIEKIITWEKLINDAEQAKSLANPDKFGYMSMIRKKAGYLRKFAPKLLNTLDLKTSPAVQPLVAALSEIEELHGKGRRQFKQNVPTEFIKKNWLDLVYNDDGKIDRAYYEIIAFTELKNCLRSGSIWIDGSLGYRDLNDYLVSPTEMKGSLTIPDTFEEYLAQRGPVLHEKLNYYQKISKNLTSIHIKKLTKDVPIEADYYRKKLFDMIPKIKLSDLVIEVDSWTNFTREFTHDATGKAPTKDELPAVFSTLLAMGMNTGLEAMSESISGMSYSQMANVKQWRFYTEALRRAQATIVNYQIKLPISEFWGEGKKSSSDGMRTKVGVLSVQADINPHYGTERGTNIIRHTSDKYVSHYVDVIATNQREAASAVDGINGHDTDLEIEVHSTDTNGYTDSTFAFMRLLGFDFKPRIRNVSTSQMFSIKPISEYKKLTKFLSRSIKLKVIEENYDEVKQILYSIQTKKVKAKLIMGKLGSYSRQNKVAEALNEIGKIEKTIFLIDYATDDELRKMITRMLNRGELLNALARDLFSGQRGKFMEKDIQRQLQSASALNILINAISLWNSVYLQEAFNHLVKTEPKVEGYMKYIAPIHWRHINFLGEYKINLLSIPKKLRKLNK